MKPRRVIVTLELTTGRRVKDLKDEFMTAAVFFPDEKMHQVQVNVVKAESAKTKNK